MSNETIEKLSEHENIIGIKDASNDLSRPTHLKKYIKHKKFYQLSGEDATQLAFLAQGGDGVISVTANVVPKKVADLHKSWFAGDFIQAMKIDAELFSLNNALFLEANPCPVKYAAFKLGICNYELRLPLCEILDENKLIIDNVLKDLNITFD
jgi:4-hydroxy-tetrahydrodipicolinate synthase